MLRRIWRKIIIHSALTLAYGVGGIDTIFRAPLWIIICLTILFSLTASIVKFEPFTWDKTAVQVFQSPQTYIQAMHTSNLFGDSFTAEQIYLDTLPFGQNTNIAVQLRNAAFPQEKLEQLRAFWTAMLAKQPSAREAYAALTAIHQSMQENEALLSTLGTWSFIEPNDPRIAGVKVFSK